MAQQSFSAAVDSWVLKSRQRLEAVLKTSAQFVIEDVIERTPVDTGFLVNSLTVSLDGPLPIRADARPAKGGSYAPPEYSLVINNADITTTIFASFIASYSAHVEYGARGRAGVGMVRMASQNWSQHVDRAVREAKARVG